VSKIQKVKFDIVSVKALGVSWRIFELECLEKYFGQHVGTTPEAAKTNDIFQTGAKYVYWKLHTEATPPQVWERCCRMAKELEEGAGVKHINDPRGWLNCHAKEKAFEVWQHDSIPCPDWFVFNNEDDFFNQTRFDYPMLIRLNNSTSGFATHLCHNSKEAIDALRKLNGEFHMTHDGIPNEGVGRKRMAVKFIPTLRPENVILSFRIIVAGNKVVVGYARIGQPSEWLAITNRFRTGMEDLFVKYQKMCQKFCEENEALIVKSVKCLGLNFQGVDVILDQNNNPYFIEVQPGFSVGYPNRSGWHPPFYNPSKPVELRSWLIANLDMMKKECPMYANIWLDKYVMFDKAFKSLKEDLG
jgi:glutathione synthase/RimK-type ligase-like ATP-grasp enzyme